MIKRINFKKIEIFFLIFWLSCFIYGWSIKYEYFQLRLLIFLPLFFIFFNVIKSRKYNFLIFPLIFFLFLFTHFLIVSIFKDNFNINLIPHIGAATLIAVIISYYYLEIIENLHLIIKYFLILVIPIMAINIFQAINFSLSDGSLFLKQLFFNCDNSVINFGKFFFKENSHFGLIATPVLLSYMFLEERLKDKFYNSFFIIFILINIVFFSTTLIVSIIFCCLLYFFYFIFISFIDVKNSNFNNENLIIFSKKNLFFKILFKNQKIYY
jgi:hypothetical protein